MGRPAHLDGPSEVGLGDPQPDHAGNGHAHTQPGEEAEQVDDGEDVVGDGVHHGQQTLEGGMEGKCSGFKSHSLH